MKAYKGFNEDRTCRGFQYKEGGEYETDKAKLCESGFHACENPLDCLRYYPAWDEARCFLVEVEGSVDEDGIDSKISCTRIRLAKELSLKQFVAAAAVYMIQHPHLPENSLVQHTDGVAGANHFVICRGQEHLKAKGKAGDVLAILEEDETGEIVGARIMEIDGTEFLPGVWYDITGEPAEGTE